MNRRFLRVSLLLIAILMCFTGCSGPKEVTDFEYRIILDGKTVDGLYSGTVENKVPNGMGKFKSDGNNLEVTYSGNWKNGNLADQGVLDVNQFELEYFGKKYTGCYSGDAMNGVPEGEGCFKGTSGESELEYTGNWKDGKFFGNGSVISNRYVVTFLDGLERIGNYSGDTKDGIACGNGMFTAVNSDNISYTYSGEWKNGLYNGIGKCVWDDESTYIQTGHFLDGEFAPTPVEYFTACGTLSSQTYQITQNAQKFLEDNPECFTQNKIDSNLLSTSFKYSSYTKNPETCKDYLVSIPNLKVIQIFEEEYWGSAHTFCILEDNARNVYSCNMYGYADGIYEGSRVNLTALLLDYFTYPNTAGQDIWAIACAAISLT